MIILSIFLKEFIDLLRDRRSLLSGFAYIAFGPLVLLVVINSLASETQTTSWSPIRFCGPSSAILKQELTASRLEFKPDAAICLNIPDNFEERLAKGSPARVQIRGDLLAQSATIDRIERSLTRFSVTLANQRVMARGLSPSVINPLVIDTQNTNSFSRGADVIARALIIMFVLSPFFVSVAAAADMTAGERERRSFEPLLVHPVSTFSIIVGKWMAAAALGITGTTACIVGGLFLLEQSSLAQLGIKLDTGAAAGLQASLYLIPLTMLAAAIQLAIGLNARNFKDAQNYLMLLSFAPAIVGFMLTGERLAKAADWPFAWELSALSGPLLGAPAPATPFVVIAAIELALTAAILAFCARQLRSEAILSQG